MNGTMYSHDPPNGYYIGNGPVYRKNYSSNFTPNHYSRHTYSAPTHENNHLQQIKQSNSVNQRHLYMTNLQQQQQRQSNLDKYNYENGGLSSSTAYYDRIHAQVRANTPVRHAQNSSSTSSIYQRSKETTPQRQLPIPVVNHDLFNPLRDNDDPSPDYPHYTMDSLIHRLIPTTTYTPKQTFIYPMLLCSRMHIRPSLLLNKLAHLTIKSTTHLTRDRSIRIMKNFLNILSQWTCTFPYDFRNTEMISEFDELLRKINSYEPTLQSDTYHMNKKLRSKLKALENYEEYIRQLNKKALNSVTQTALLTDIINECPTSILFAQQLTHIELDRLKPIGAEELIQYFIMKLASEEARAHPSRTPNNQTVTSNNKFLTIVHDKKLTFCLETYVQWFNRLTFFVTTEIVKHTQRRLRIRLINYFIDAAYECLRLHNFNSMIGIIGGLNMQPVKRLRRTWEKIQLEKFEQLEQYMNVSKNFSNYRRILKTAMEEAETNGWRIDKIVIPFTSIVLQDVYFIKTHSKDYTEEGGVNLKKYYSMAKCISEEFVQCKQSKCSSVRNDVIINYIITSPTFNEDSLMLASFECEPAITTNEKQKLAMLQSSVNKSS